ncbi:MAG: STAS domain-containing protein [Bacteroidota bacterium]|jgi:anti-sigma B factor antagonist
MILRFKITEENNIQILTISGELIDKNQAIDLLKAFEELLETGVNKILIDIKDLKYLNSSGLNVLIQILTKTRLAGGDSVIYNVNSKINELLIITKLHTLFKIAENKEKAFQML